MGFDSTQRSLSASLVGGNVHVWCTVPENVGDATLLAAYRDLLDPEERRRHQRLRFARHRHSFLVSHALLRATLSRYAAEAPRTWTFERNAHGRPEIAAPHTARRLRFNLSHTQGLVACAVTFDADIGVDVESRCRRRINLRVADRFFSPPEVSDLRALPEAEQRQRFLELWTLKEAYIKARGMGLALPLRRFGLTLPASGQPHLTFLDGIEDDPTGWQFTLDRSNPDHYLAVAVRTQASQTIEIRVRDTVPLVS